MADDAPQTTDGAEDDLDAIEAAALRAAGRYLDIDAEIAQAKDEFVKKSHLDEDFDRRLKDLELRASTHKGLRDVKKEQAAKRQSKDGEEALGLGVGMTIAYAILGMPLMGAGLGWLLDNRFGTKVWVGVGVLLGATAGVGYALFALQRINKDS